MKRFRFLIFGETSQIGQAISPLLKLHGDVIVLSRKQADFSLPEMLPLVLKREKPDVIINTAAFTSVDLAEENQDLAYTINAVAPGLIAKTANELGAWLIHYSTDYVFDGEKATPYTEIDTANPLNVYGHTKLKGEEAIAASTSQYLTFRTSWVYSVSGTNFITKILDLAKSEKKLYVVNDQVGAPTSAQLVAEVTTQAISRIINNSPLPSGLFHLSASGETNWSDYARMILSEAKIMNPSIGFFPNIVHPVPTSNAPNKAKRPRNSRLSTKKLSKSLHIEFPHWQQGVLPVLSQIIGST